VVKGRERIIEIIRARHAEILKEWINCLFDSYPEDGAKFFREKKNQFTNPVGHIFRTRLGEAFSELVFKKDNAALKESLDEIIRIRAVQDFTPADALSFILDLKGIIRAYCLKEIEKQGLLEELWHMDARIDEACLIAFNIYSSCRQELADIKVNEFKSNVAYLLKKHNLLVEEVPPIGPGHNGYSCQVLTKRGA